MKIVFFGTPDYVIPILDKLHKTYKSKLGESPIAAIVTQKPRPAGRKQTLEYSAVDKWAHKKGVPTYYSLKNLIQDPVLRLTKDRALLGVLAAYGKILPNEVLNIFPNGILNIHPSLLPKFRGASPVQSAITAGESETGITIIKMDEKIDHGPIVTQTKESLHETDTTKSVRNRLFRKSADILLTLIPPLLDGKVNLRQQTHKKATFTTLVKKDHAFIPPEYLDKFTASSPGLEPTKKWEIPFIKAYSLVPSAYSLERFIRAMVPWPVSWTNVKLNSEQEIKRLRILKAHVETRKVKRDTRNEKRNKSYPVSRIPYLVLDEVQLEGKNSVSFKQFTEAYPDFKFSD